MHDPLPAFVGVIIVLCGVPARRFLTTRQSANLIHERS
jgi:hypothetical protein